MIQIEPSVLAHLSAGEISGNVFRLTAELDRAEYFAVNRVLEAAGGKWNRKAKGHVFNDPAGDVIDDLIVTGAYTRIKQDLGQFDTPEALADEMAQRAGITPRMSMLEPSAGVGNIVLAAERVGANVTAYELDQKRMRTAMERCALVGGIRQADFLTVMPEPKFDIVLMNPPFLRQADIDHIRHASAFLKPGGRLFSIAAAGVEFRQDRKAADFRSFVTDHGGTITRLPENSFKSAGTLVRTVLVKLTQKG